MLCVLAVSLSLVEKKSVGDLGCTHLLNKL